MDKGMSVQGKKYHLHIFVFEIHPFVRWGAMISGIRVSPGSEDLGDDIDDGGVRGLSEFDTLDSVPLRAASTIGYTPGDLVRSNYRQ